MTTNLIIATACVSIFIWELLRSIYRKWFKEEPIKHYQPERHVYPKEDDNISELDKTAIEKNDKEYELAGGCLVKKDCECDCAGKWKDKSTDSEDSLAYAIQSLGVTADQAAKTFGSMSKIDLIDANHRQLHKDCEYDCAAECKTSGAELNELYIKRLSEIGIVASEAGKAFAEYFHNDCQGHVPLTHYMSRGNKRYFRGENVKVVVTVKGGGCENS